LKVSKEPLTLSEYVKLVSTKNELKGWLIVLCYLIF